MRLWRRKVKPQALVRPPPQAGQQLCPAVCGEELNRRAIPVRPWRDFGPASHAARTNRRPEGPAFLSPDQRAGNMVPAQPVAWKGRPTRQRVSRKWPRRRVREPGLQGVVRVPSRGETAWVFPRRGLTSRAGGFMGSFRGLRTARWDHEPRSGDILVAAAWPGMRRQAWRRSKGWFTVMNGPAPLPPCASFCKLGISPP